jgi:hypothetical protein
MHHHQKIGLFQDSRDIALAVSTDGAQLTMKKQSNTWLVIIILLNLPAEIRVRSGNVVECFATPGPHSPGHIESFLYPLLQDMIKASEGIWMWDAVDSSYFVNRAHICMALGDMLGSAKLSGMAGHSAVFGDRFSMVKGARSSRKKGAKAQYYPISPPQSDTYNRGRPSYDLDDIPMRTESEYWAIIDRLEKASSKAARTTITRETGISRMPLCAASPAYVHPSFFPLDPFHLFYENDTPTLWDIWTISSSPSEPVHLSIAQARKFGELVQAAMPTLPPAFCGPIRDPFLKRQSQYKIYEWMALVHWYILPIGIELGFSPALLENFSHFVEAIEFAMTTKPRTAKDIISLHDIIKRFLTGFEKLYIGNDPEKVSRSRLCIFQLIHVPKHIEWNGSIRLGSQATVERAIGEAGHKIRSKKSPFANLANIIFEREMAKILCLYYPSLHSQPTHSTTSPLSTSIEIRKREYNASQDFAQHLHAICLWLQRDSSTQMEISWWGKLRLPGGAFLRSRLGETRGNHPKRSQRYFEATDGSATPIFAEALAFYEVSGPHQILVVCRPVSKLQQVLKIWRGQWSENIQVLPASALCNIVGIWSYQDRVYLLRKHPGLSHLTPTECGVDEDGDNEDIIL